MKVILLLSISIVLLTLIVACCIGQESGELEGILWRLDSYADQQGNLVKVLRNTKITAQFKEGTVNGSAGCNTYFASYRISGSALIIGPIGITEMYCTEPDGIMEQESDYLAALESVKGFTIEGSKLEMTNGQGILVLVFTAG